MVNGDAGSGNQRRQVHTEVRLPVEAVVSKIIWYVFGAIEVILGARFVLKLLGANAKVDLVSMVYEYAAVFMAPFRGIFETQEVSNGSIFEWNALVAIVVYALASWGLTSLLSAIIPRRNAVTTERIERNDQE